MVKNCCFGLQNIAVDDLASWENVCYSDTKTKAPLCTVDACLPPLTLNRSSKHLSPRQLTAFVHVFRRQAWTETPCVWCRPFLCFESLLCSRMQMASLQERRETSSRHICRDSGRSSQAFQRMAGSQIGSEGTPTPQTGPYLPRIKDLIHGRACSSEAEQLPRPQSS